MSADCSKSGIETTRGHSGPFSALFLQQWDFAILIFDVQHCCPILTVRWGGGGGREQWSFLGEKHQLCTEHSISISIIIVIHCHGFEGET